MTPTKKLNQLGVAEAARLIRGKKISARDVIEACFRQIEAVDPDIKAWVCMDKNHALDQLKIVEADILRKGGSVLYGIPVGVKDVMNTVGFPNQMGSPIWDKFMPGNDARIVSNLKWAGGVVAGKTSTAEFAVHAFNKTVNPHHFEHAPGTSSSGSAAAVASYMVPVALGTQTAGSIIRPASYCGVYGFKPSFGLIPRTGILKTTDSLDQVGFFVRCVEDLKLIFDIIRVDGLDYPISHACMNDPVLQNKKKDKWLVGVNRSRLWVWDYVEPYVNTEFESFLKTLSRDKDIEIVDVRLDDDFNTAHDIHALIYERTLAYYFRDEYADNKHLMSDILRGMIERGQKTPLEDYLNALERQAELSRKLDRVYEDVDVMLNYSTAATAMKGLDVMDKPDTCLIWTLCGIPVINIPAFKGAGDLPFGLQVMSEKYSDYRLLKFVSLLKEKNFISDGTYPDIANKLEHQRQSAP